MNISPISLNAFRTKSNTKKAQKPFTKNPSFKGTDDNILQRDRMGDTIFHSKKMDDKEIRYYGTFALPEFRQVISAQNIYGETPLHRNTDKTQLESIAQIAPDEFIEASQIPDNNGTTPMHGNKAVVEIMAQIAPEKFKEAMLMQNQQGCTPLHYFSNNNDIVKLMAKTAPDEFKEAMLIQDYYGFTPLEAACYKESSAESIKTMARYALSEFRQAMTLKDGLNNTPLHLCKDLNSIEAMAYYAPEEFEEALAAKNSYNETPLLYKSSIDGLNTEKIEKIADVNPEAFKKIINIPQSKNNETIVSYAASNEYPETLSIIAKIAPDEFKDAILMQDKYGNTPLHHVDSESAHIIAKTAPYELEDALIMQNIDRQTPLHTAKDPEVFNIFANIAPDSFREALLILDNKGKYPIHYVKENNDYKTIETMIKTTLGESVEIKE